MRVWWLLPLLLVTSAQAQLYSGYVAFIPDGSNDQEGYPVPVRDSRTDINGVDILETPNALQVRLRTAGGFSTAATQGVASEHEATVLFGVVGDQGTTNIRLVVNGFGAGWSRDGIDQGVPEGVDETDTPWSFEVAIPKSKIVPDGRVRPGDLLRGGVAYINATTSFGPTNDRAPNDGTAEDLVLPGGIVLAAWENQHGPEHVAGVDVAAGRGGALHASYLITGAQSAEPGLYHRVVGSNAQTWLGPIAVQSDGADPDALHTAIAVDWLGNVHIIYPTSTGTDGGYRYFGLEDGQWTPSEVAPAGQVTTGPTHRADIAVGAGRIAVALPAEGGVRILERIDARWVELAAVAGASWPSLAVNEDGDVLVSFVRDGALWMARESASWSPLAIEESLQVPQADQADQANPPAYAFALRPDGMPAWVWRTQGQNGPGNQGADWMYMALVKNVVHEEEIPYQRNAPRVSLSFDDYGDAHVGLGGNSPADFLLRTVYGHWYQGPQAEIHNAVAAGTPLGHAALVGTAGATSALRVNWWPESPIYPGFAPRYDPAAGVELGEETNVTTNETVKPGAKKDSPAPVWIPAAAGAIAMARRRR